MIRFFRKIRQNLLSDGKIGKYLKYAVGEIVLVVIGILIALQINNWNELKKTKTKERFALEEIVSDLDQNITSLEVIVYKADNSISNCVKSLKIIIENIEKTKVYNDSLSAHFWRNFTYLNVDIKSSGYQSLSSIGMNLISSNELRSNIGKYYTYLIPDEVAAYQEMRDDFYHYILDIFRTEFITKGENKAYPRSYESLLNNRDYIESLKFFLNVYVAYQDKSIETLNESRRLKQLIEKHLSIEE